MNRTVIIILVLGLLFISVLAPFSGLAALMTLLFLAALVSLGWSLLQALTGNQS